MSLEFKTRQIDAQSILGVRTTTTMDKLAAIMGPLFGEIYGYIRQHGQQPAGMPLAIYHSLDGNAVELECAMPVASPPEGTDRIRPGELPAGTVATVTHTGPYDSLGETWSAVMEWIGAQEFQVAHAPWEVYVTDPDDEPDQSRWRTDIFVPVRTERQTGE